jgi:hypothetical protein
VASFAQEWELQNLLPELPFSTDRLPRRNAFVPDRLAIFITQILRPKGRLTRVMAETHNRVATLRYMSAPVTSPD